MRHCNYAVNPLNLMTDLIPCV